MAGLLICVTSVGFMLMVALTIDGFCDTIKKGGDVMGIEESAISTKDGSSDEADFAIDRVRKWLDLA